MRSVWLQRLTLLLIGLLFSHLLLIFNMLILEYHEFFVRDNFFRWDSGNYLLLAEKGLYMEYCDGEFSRMLRAPYRCGTAGWFPGYSYLIYLLKLLIGDAAVAGMIISKLFFIFSLYLFMVIAKLNEVKTKAILLVMCFCVFFGSIYYHAIFPISQFICFALAAIYAVKKNKIYLASIFTLAACLSYSTGFLLGGALSLALLIQHYSRLRTTLFMVILPALGSVLGLISHFVVLHFQTGYWNAFFLVQGRYGHKLRTPLDKVMQVFDTIPDPITDLMVFVNIQSILILIAFGLITFYFFKNRYYRKPLLLILFCYLTTYLWFPYLVGSQYLSLYRAESLLIPMLFFAAKLPSRFILLIFLILLLVHLPMNHLFFKGILV